MTQRIQYSAEIARCPRCRGRLTIERDRYGAFESCFMCGFTKDRHAGPILNPFAEDKVELQAP